MLIEEGEEGIMVDGKAELEDKIFHRTLVGKLCTDNPFNNKVFKTKMIQAWRLKNIVKAQDLGKNLFLFRFSLKSDTETILRNGLWNFDRNLLNLKKVFSEEPSSRLEMHYRVFWVRVYDLPLKLRSETMDKQLGGIIVHYEDIDPKETNAMGSFLQIKAKIILRKLLKRGTIIKYQGRCLKVFFKYERLPMFCFACERIGN